MLKLLHHLPDSSIEDNCSYSIFAVEPAVVVSSTADNHCEGLCISFYLVWIGRIGLNSTQPLYREDGAGPLLSRAVYLIEEKWLEPMSTEYTHSYIYTCRFRVLETPPLSADMDHYTSVYASRSQSPSSLHFRKIR